jgi:predicted DNA-binding ribbon-helix-helix protein
VRLERIFWEEIERLAEERGVSLAKLVADTDAERPAGQSLASALRVEAAAALRAATGSEGKPVQGLEKRAATGKSGTHVR